MDLDGEGFEDIEKFWTADGIVSSFPLIRIEFITQFFISICTQLINDTETGTIASYDEDLNFDYDTSNTITGLQRKCWINIKLAFISSDFTDDDDSRDDRDESGSVQSGLLLNN